MSLTYYTSFSVNYDEKFAHKEYNFAMVIQALQFCIQNGRIDTIGIDETPLISNVYFSAIVGNSERRFYRFHCGNVIALRRLYAKFAKLAFHF